MRLNSLLADLHRQPLVLPTGNGTTALTAALSVLGPGPKSVAFPAGVCVNVPMAVRLAGHKAVYLDVDPGTLGLSVETLNRCPERPDAVIAVHAYGAVCDAAGLRAWCDERKILLIEDLATAHGASLGGRPAGSFGHIAVASFGAGKIVGHGTGGAAMTDDRGLFEKMESAVAAFPAWSPAAQSAITGLMVEFRDLYNKALGRDADATWPSFAARVDATGRRFLCRFEPSWDAPISGLLDGLPAAVAARARRAAALEKAVTEARLPVEIVSPPPGSVCWRFNLQLPSGRDEVLRGLLARGFKASSWYPSSDLFFRRRSERPWPLPVADRFGDRLLNLWVDGVDESYPEAVVAAVGGILRDARVLN